MRGISPEVARARATRRTKLHGPCTARVQPKEHVLVVWGRSFELKYRGFFAPGSRLFRVSDFARARVYVYNERYKKNLRDLWRRSI